MAKHPGIVVTMSEELRAWVHAQASVREIEDTTYIRMVLAEARSGIAATALKAATPLAVAAPDPVQRDVLDVSSDPYGRSPAMDALPQLRLVETLSPEERRADLDDVMQAIAAEEAALPIDVDALVDQQLAEAEAAGLTQRQIEEAEGDVPGAGVRVLGPRIPPRYSPGTQPRHLMQHLG